MLNYAKVLIANFLLGLFFLFISSSLVLAEKVQKKQYPDRTCYESLVYAECIFNDNWKVAGGYQSGQWRGNIRLIKPSGFVYYHYHRINKEGQSEVRYGIQNYDNGYYVGDLSSNGDKYGFGTYYFDNGVQFSFKNWHKEKKIGYIKYSDGERRIGRFDKNFNRIIYYKLDSDFQLELNKNVSLARGVQTDFIEEYEKFLLDKKISLSPNSSDKKIVINEISSNENKISNSKYNKKTNNYDYNNLLIGIFILGIFIFFIWLNKSKQKIKKDQPINDQNKKKRYKELSLADSKKIFSYGVKDFMSRPAACKVLRLEYIKWKTVSNNSNFVKKSYANKNLNEIIKLRSKLKC